MLSGSFYPVINKPTRITEYSATIIDNIFCNFFNEKSLCGILYNDISDHLPIFISSDLKIERKQKHLSRTHNLSPDNIDRFNTMLRNFNWDIIQETQNVDLSYQMFLENFNDMYDKCCPYKVTGNKTIKRKIWMSNALLKSCRTKEILYKKFKVSPTPQNKLNYCKYKNKLTSLLREAERTYYGTRFDQAKSDIKETWEIIKEALDKNNSNAVLPDSFNHNNIVIDNKKQICNKFNEYFVNVGPNLDKKN